MTVKIYEEPSLVDLLFTESRNGEKKGSYIPLQILLLLLIREDVTEREPEKIILRESLMMHLKLNNKQILKYVVEESEICVILVIKLGQYY